MTLNPQRLRRLVKHRERLERIQELQLAEAQRLYFTRLTALNQSEAQRDRYLDTPVPQSGRVHPDDLSAGGDYLRRVEREIGARAAAVTHSEGDVAEERDELLARRRDRKAIEALLDRRLEEERIAHNRADIKRIDELAINRWQPPARPSPGGTA
jgi:flagellar export protein FliJ